MSVHEFIVEECARGPDDDSPFLSIADFFSLISLVLIYITVVLAPQSQLPQNAIEAATAVTGGLGPDSPVDSRFAYVSLFSEGDRSFLLRVAHPAGRPEERHFALAGRAEALATDWVMTSLKSGQRPEKVIFSMGPSEPMPEMHKLLNHLVDVASNSGFSVDMIFVKHESDH